MSRILFSLQLVVLSCFIFMLSKFHQQCGSNHVREVCNAYAKKKVGGKFCDTLCSNNAVIGKCLSVNAGKTVFELQLDDDKFILKFSTSINYGTAKESSIPNEMNIFNKSNNSGWSVNFYGNCGEMYALQPVLNLAGEIFGDADDIDDMLNLPEIFDEYSQLIEAGDNSSSILWLLKHVKRTAEVFIFNSFIRAYFPSFEQKIEFMKQVFLMLERLVTSNESNLQICDVHMNNFGILRDGKVKIIDADHIFPMAELSEKFIHLPCSSDDHCSIGDSNDCMGVCNMTTNTCRSTEHFLNLKNICNIMRSVVIPSLSLEELSNISLLYNKIYECSTSYSLSSKDELEKLIILLKIFEKIN